MNEIDISKKYKPLFQLLETDKYSEVDTVIMTGGRASGKSYVVALLSIIGLVSKQWSVLYTRYTNMSIVDSIKPEVSDKIEILGFEDKVIDTQKQIECGTERIAFKGIKTGSKVQTANLKSLQGFNCFVVDEAEELPDFATFKKVFYSIRSVTKRNLTILILNPTTKEHWIFREFFEKKGLEGGENCIIDNVMYIHTSYLDVNQKYIPKNIIRDYEKLKVENIDEYNNIVLGGWIKNPEGQIFTNIEIIEKLPESYESVYFGLDFGYITDCTAITETRKSGNNLYIQSHCYTQIDNAFDLYEVICAIDKEAVYWADSADPGMIGSLRRMGLNIYAVKKYAGSVKTGIDIMKRYKLHVVKDANFLSEINNYTWKKVNGITLNEPIDKYNHNFDSCRYAIMSNLM